MFPGKQTLQTSLTPLPQSYQKTNVFEITVPFPSTTLALETESIILWETFAWSQEYKESPLFGGKFCWINNNNNIKQKLYSNSDAYL